MERLAGEPHTRLRFFCSPHHQDSALYPVISHLERAAAFHRDDTAEQRLDKLEALLAQATNDVSAVAPLLADLLAVPTGERYPALNLTPQKRKEKTLAALTAQVEGLSAREPVLMVYEDVHWSDPTTRESLDLLVDRLPGRRILAIITFRPEFSPPWIGRPNVTMLTLNRLAPRQRAEMIGHVTSGKALPKEISDQIIERTDGIPLFIEELTKSVVESGLVTDAGDSYAVTGPAAPLGIPTTLHASLLARLDRLAPTREVAQIGAALGRSFSHEMIGAVDATCRSTNSMKRWSSWSTPGLIFRRGTSAGRGVHLQARSGAGCRLQHTPAQSAAADPRADCDRLGEAIPRGRCRAATACGATLCRSWSDGKSNQLLAQSWTTGGRTFGHG